MSLRSPLSRVLGLGSAKGGTQHWWAERVSAIALVPLTLWFLIALLTLPDLGYGTVRLWLSVPITAFLAIVLIAVASAHAYLGSVVIIEDYVAAAGPKVLSLLLLRFLFVLSGAAGIFAVLRVIFAPGSA